MQERANLVQIGAEATRSDPDIDWAVRGDFGAVLGEFGNTRIDWWTGDNYLSWV